MEALEVILADQRFHLPSPQATRTRELASSIVTWGKNPANHDLLSQMSDYMATSLKSCMVTNYYQNKEAKDSKDVGFIPSFADF